MVLQKTSTTKVGDPIIQPILTSTQFIRQKSLGIEVVGARQDGAGAEEEKKTPGVLPALFVRDLNDPVAWYQVFNKNRVSLVTKMRLNRPVWKYSAFFPGNALFLVACRNWLVLALDSGVLHFLDPEHGAPCYPTVWVDGSITYLRSCDDKVICFTTENVLYVWRLFGENGIECKVKAKWLGDLPEVKKIVLANELEDGSLSPIIVTDEYSVRYSQSQGGWVFYGVDIPSVFETERRYEVTADCEKAFNDALLFHDEDVLLESFCLLIKCFLKQESKLRAMELVNELLTSMKNHATHVGGVPARKLLDTGLQLIREENEELATMIENSPEFKAATTEHVEPSASEQPQQPSRAVSEEWDKMARDMKGSDTAQQILDQPTPQKKASPKRKKQVAQLNVVETPVAESPGETACQSAPTTAPVEASQTESPGRQQPFKWPDEFVMRCINCNFASLGQEQQIEFLHSIPMFSQCKESDLETLLKSLLSAMEYTKMQLLMKMQAQQASAAAKRPLVVPLGVVPQPVTAGQQRPVQPPVCVQPSVMPQQVVQQPAGPSVVVQPHPAPVPCTVTGAPAQQPVQSPVAHQQGVQRVSPVPQAPVQQVIQPVQPVVQVVTQQPAPPAASVQDEAQQTSPTPQEPVAPPAQVTSQQPLPSTTAAQEQPAPQAAPVKDEAQQTLPTPQKPVEPVTPPVQVPSQPPAPQAAPVEDEVQRTSPTPQKPVEPVTPPAQVPSQEPLPSTTTAQEQPAAQATTPEQAPDQQSSQPVAPGKDTTTTQDNEPTANLAAQPVLPPASSAQQPRIQPVIPVPQEPGQVAQQVPSVEKVQIAQAVPVQAPPIQQPIAQRMFAQPGMHVHLPSAQHGMLQHQMAEPTTFGQPAAQIQQPTAAMTPQQPFAGHPAVQPTTTGHQRVKPARHSRKAVLAPRIAQLRTEPQVAAMPQAMVAAQLPPTMVQVPVGAQFVMPPQIPMQQVPIVQQQVMPQAAPQLQSHEQKNATVPTPGQQGVVPIQQPQMVPQISQPVTTQQGTASAPQSTEASPQPKKRGRPRKNAAEPVVQVQHSETTQATAVAQIPGVPVPTIPHQEHEPQEKSKQKKDSPSRSPRTAKPPSGQMTITSFYK